MRQPIEIEVKTLGSRSQATARCEVTPGVYGSFSRIERSGALAMSELIEQLAKSGLNGRRWVHGAMAGTVMPKPRRRRK